MQTTQYKKIPIKPEIYAKLEIKAKAEGKTIGEYVQNIILTNIERAEEEREKDEEEHIVMILRNEDAEDTLEFTLPRRILDAIRGENYLGYRAEEFYKQAIKSLFSIYMGNRTYEEKSALSEKYHLTDGDNTFDSPDSWP